jgi:hypothetical protein
MYFADASTIQLYANYSDESYLQLGADISVTHVNGDTWMLRCQDDTPTPGVTRLTVLQNGTPVATRDDSNPLSGPGYLALYISNAATIMDAFSGGETATTGLLDSFNGADTDPLNPAFWTASGGRRYGSANDRVVFIRCTGDTNAPIEDQTDLATPPDGYGLINVDEIDNTWV